MASSVGDEFRVLRSVGSTFLRRRRVGGACGGLTALSCTPAAERLGLVSCMRRPKKNTAACALSRPARFQPKKGWVRAWSRQRLQAARPSSLNVPPCVVLPAHPPHT